MLIAEAIITELLVTTWAPIAVSLVGVSLLLCAAAFRMRVPETIRALRLAATVRLIVILASAVIAGMSVS